VNAAHYILILGVRFYRWAVSPAKLLLFGPLGRCRFSPTCSAFALEALQHHGALAGSLLAVKRVCRCHPWGGCGDDPVPLNPNRNPNPDLEPVRQFTQPLKNEITIKRLKGSADFTETSRLPAAPFRSSH
jgi:putative membrane protein insertion efficiency factor